MYKSDLLIGIGTTFHLRQTGSLPDKTVEKGRIARIDLDINELRHSRVPLDLEIHADAKAALAALERALQRTDGAEHRRLAGADRRLESEISLAGRQARQAAQAAGMSSKRSTPRCAASR